MLFINSKTGDGVSFPSVLCQYEKRISLLTAKTWTWFAHFDVFLHNLYNMTAFTTQKANDIL